MFVIILITRVNIRARTLVEHRYITHCLIYILMFSRIGQNAALITNVVHRPGMITDGTYTISYFTLLTVPTVDDILNIILIIRTRKNWVNREWLYSWVCVVFLDFRFWILSVGTTRIGIIRCCMVFLTVNPIRSVLVRYRCRVIDTVLDTRSGILSDRFWRVFLVSIGTGISANLICSCSGSRCRMTVLVISVIDVMIGRRIVLITMVRMV